VDRQLHLTVADAQRFFVRTCPPTMRIEFAAGEWVIFGGIPHLINRDKTNALHFLKDGNRVLICNGYVH